MRITLIKTTTRRRPTWISWLLITALLFIVCAIFVSNLYPFLAKEAQPQEGVLIVEGWIQDYALEEAIEIYKAGNYDKIAATGVQIETGVHLAEWKTYSEMTAARLVELGIPPEEIIVTSVQAQRDRTYTAALALKETLESSGNMQTKLHLISVGPHARRSCLLYEKAFGPGYKIGISSLEDQSYDSDRWWASSNGFRSVVDELIAYIYVKLFFRP